MERPPEQQEPEERSPPCPPLGDVTAQIPPAGSGERLGFLLGIQPSPSGSKDGGTQGGRPPVRAAVNRRSRKRCRSPMDSSSNGEKQLQKAKPAV